MRVWFGILAACIVAGGVAHSSRASVREYELTVARTEVHITGRPVEKITVNGALPAPTLRFREGDEAVIHVRNAMQEPTSIHWHGLLLPGEMDGVAGFNNYQEIAPGARFTYRFPIRQNGTYWYHAHTGGQEQDGLYGAIIADPKGRDPIHAERDYTLVVSDLSEESSGEVLANLKKSSDYYARSQLTLSDLFADAKTRGWDTALNDAKRWGKMRMMRTDLSDVSGPFFLINGKTQEQNWTGIFRPGERVRLRFINASGTSFFDVRIPGLKLRVVQADGQHVEPVTVDEFRFAPAETYDVVVTPQEDKPYSIVAEPIDRSGVAVATLATAEGQRGEPVARRPRALLSMGDMNMELMMQDDADMEMNHADMVSGWAQTGAPKGARTLDYADLRYAGTQKDTRAPGRTIEVRLGGNMERYIWTINGQTYPDAEPIRLRYGEQVRLSFVNETMMAHPMHLHGMFVQLENGQPAEKLPNKHTVIVPPGGSYSVLLTADEMGEWAFHCHLLYHMSSGMMRQVVVAKLEAEDMPKASPAPAHGGHQHHAH